MTTVATIAELRAAVAALAAPPFSKRLSLAGLDELAASGDRLRPLVAEVLGEVDRSVRDAAAAGEPPVAIGARMANLLALLRFPPRPPGEPPLAPALANGDRDACLAVLAWALPRLAALRKRAYLAHYLVPAAVPPDAAGDSGVADLAATLASLQAEFAEAHQQLERAQAAVGAEAAKLAGGSVPLVGPAVVTAGGPGDGAGAVGTAGAAFEPSGSAPPGGAPPLPALGDLQRAVAQLEQERLQLVDRISGMRKKAAGLPGFKPLLEGTAQLRREQEEEGRLAARLGAQRAALAVAEGRYAEAARTLAQARAAAHEGLTPMGLLEAVRADTAAARRRARDGSGMVVVARSRRDALQRRLQQLEDAASGPAGEGASASAQLRDEDDVARLEAAKVAATARELAAAQQHQRVAAAARGAPSAGDAQLAKFQQQAAGLARRLAEREEQLAGAQGELRSVARQLEAEEASLATLASTATSSAQQPRLMTDDEFARFAAALRAKSATVQQLQDALTEAQSATAALTAHEAELRAQAEGLDAALAAAETQRGVDGTLADVSAAVGDTERVARIVESALGDHGRGTEPPQVVAVALEEVGKAASEMKQAAAAAVQHLRALRAEFQGVDATYLRHKAAHDAVAAPLDAEAAGLQRDADAAEREDGALQARLDDTRRALDDARAAAARAAQEAAYARGDGRYRRDCATAAEYTRAQAEQTRQLAAQLAHQRAAAVSAASRAAGQRAAYAGLQAVLDVKAALLREALAAAADTTDSDTHVTAAAAAVRMFWTAAGADVLTL